MGTCLECDHWKYREENIGFCRANAPSPLITSQAEATEFIIVWPSTKKDEIACGQFERGQ